MAFTVHDFMHLERFPEQVLLTPDVPIGSLEIHSISVIEMPVGAFVRANEMVLTTAIGCREDEDMLMAFVKDIIASGAAVIAFAFESDADYVPETVVLYAQENGVALILLSWLYRFSEITETVIDNIRGDKRRITEFYEELQKKILHLYLNKKDLQACARMIGSEIGCKMVITDHSQNVFEASEINLNEYIQYDKISANGDVYGYVYIKPNNCTREGLFKHSHFITTPLALWFDRTQTIDKTRAQIVDDFIWDLTQGKFASMDLSFSKARALGLSINKSYCCIVGKITLAASESSLSPDILEWLEYNHSKLLADLLLFKKKTSKDLLVTIHSDSMIIYFGSTKHITSDDIHQHLDVLDKYIAEHFKCLTIYWGISPIPDSPGLFEITYQDANLASNICCAENMPDRRCEYRQTMVYRLLSESIKDQAIRILASDMLKPLKQYMNEKSVDLMGVIKHYFSNDYNVSKTAQSLYLHRQSLLYRLDKIEELLDIDLSTHQGKFTLELCIFMETYGNMQKLF